MRASRLLAILCGLLLASVAEPDRLAAQLSSSDANALGLEIAWNSQLQLPLDGRGIASVNLWLNASKQRAYAVVRLPERMIYVAADELDASNQPIGIEGAKLSALSMAHRITGVTEGFDAQELVVPQVLLVATTRAGLVHCFDAETGRLQWATSCGVSSAPGLSGRLILLGRGGCAGRTPVPAGLGHRKTVAGDQDAYRHRQLAGHRRGDQSPRRAGRIPCRTSILRIRGRLYRHRQGLQSVRKRSSLGVQIERSRASGSGQSGRSVPHGDSHRHWLAVRVRPSSRSEHRIPL